MPASFVVIRKNPRDYTPAFDLESAGVTLEGAPKALIAFGGNALMGLRRAAENTDCEQRENES